MKEKNLGYLEAVIESATFSIAKNLKTDREKFTLDPSIQINGNKSQIERVSAILAEQKIDHSKKFYKYQHKIVCRIHIGSIFNLVSLLEKIGDEVCQQENIATLKKYLQLRAEKMAVNRKARYGQEELDLYEKLRDINGRARIEECISERVA